MPTKKATTKRESTNKKKKRKSADGKKKKGGNDKKKKNKKDSSVAVGTEPGEDILTDEEDNPKHDDGREEVLVTDDENYVQQNDVNVGNNEDDIRTQKSALTEEASCFSIYTESLKGDDSESYDDETASFADASYNVELKKPQSKNIKKNEGNNNNKDDGGPRIIPEKDGTLYEETISADGESFDGIVAKLYQLRSKLEGTGEAAALLRAGDVLKDNPNVKVKVRVGVRVKKKKKNQLTPTMGNTSLRRGRLQRSAFGGNDDDDGSSYMLENLSQSSDVSGLTNDNINLTDHHLSDHPRIWDESIHESSSKNNSSSDNNNKKMNRRNGYRSLDSVSTYSWFEGETIESGAFSINESVQQQQKKLSKDDNDVEFHEEIIEEEEVSLKDPFENQRASGTDGSSSYFEEIIEEDEEEEVRDDEEEPIEDILLQAYTEGRDLTKNEIRRSLVAINSKSFRISEPETDDNETPKGFLNQSIRNLLTSESSHNRKERKKKQKNKKSEKKDTQQKNDEESSTKKDDVASLDDSASELFKLALDFSDSDDNNDTDSGSINSNVTEDDLQEVWSMFKDNFGCSTQSFCTIDSDFEEIEEEEKEEEVIMTPKRRKGTVLSAKKGKDKNRKGGRGIKASKTGSSPKKLKKSKRSGRKGSNVQSKTTNDDNAESTDDGELMTIPEEESEDDDNIETRSKDNPPSSPKPQTPSVVPFDDIVKSPKRQSKKKRQSIGKLSTTKIEKTNDNNENSDEIPISTLTTEETPQPVKKKKSKVKATEEKSSNNDEKSDTVPITITITTEETLEENDEDDDKPTTSQEPEFPPPSTTVDEKTDDDNETPAVPSVTEECFTNDGEKKNLDLPASGREDAYHGEKKITQTEEEASDADENDPTTIERIGEETKQDDNKIKHVNAESTAEMTVAEEEDTNRDENKTPAETKTTTTPNEEDSMPIKEDSMSSIFLPRENNDGYKIYTDDRSVQRRQRNSTTSTRRRSRTASPRVEKVATKAGTPEDDDNTTTTTSSTTSASSPLSLPGLVFDGNNNGGRNVKNKVDMKRMYNNKNNKQRIQRKSDAVNGSQQTSSRKYASLSPRRSKRRGNKGRGGADGIRVYSSKTTEGDDGIRVYSSRTNEVHDGIRVYSNTTNANDGNEEEETYQVVGIARPSAVSRSTSDNTDYDGIRVYSNNTNANDDNEEEETYQVVGIARPSVLSRSTSDGADYRKLRQRLDKRTSSKSKNSHVDKDTTQQPRQLPPRFTTQRKRSQRGKVNVKDDLHEQLEQLKQEHLQQEKLSKENSTLRRSAAYRPID